MSNKKDFRYFSFGISKETLKDYIANTSSEKLQKRMMQKHKLSSHSKFNKASHAQQKAHIKNLKQLRQIRGR